MSKKIFKGDGTVEVSSVIIATDNVDSQGDRIVTSNLKLPNQVPVTINFDNSNIVGVAENIRVEDGGIVADLKLKDNYSGYPAIGFQILKRDGNLIHGIGLQEVSLCMQNADKSIPPIH